MGPWSHSSQNDSNFTIFMDCAWEAVRGIQWDQGVTHLGFRKRVLAAREEELGSHRPPDLSSSRHQEVIIIVIIATLSSQCQQVPDSAHCITPSRRVGSCEDGELEGSGEEETPNQGHHPAPRAESGCRPGGRCVPDA